MEIFIVVFLVMLLIIAMMAVGLLMRKPITGSCGGMAAIGMDTACDVCGGDQKICETESKKASEKAKAKGDLAYDASQK